MIQTLWYLRASVPHCQELGRALPSTKGQSAQVTTQAPGSAGNCANFQELGSEDICTTK